MSISTETETVVKKILPYLGRRGYDIEHDLDFETAVKLPDRYSKGYVDILVTCGKSKPLFLIEAKRFAKKLSKADRDQGVDYARDLKVPFVVVTNGADIQCFNATTKTAIKWNGKLTERIPTKTQLDAVIKAFRADKTLTDVPLANEAGLPFRPGLALRQLNALFARCHNAIRKIEKDEEHAFADFSKLLFLKLLEEKVEVSSGFKLPYSYLFHELAQRPKSEADQVQSAIASMIDAIKSKTNYGDVLAEPLYLKKPATFLYIVQELAAVNFTDSSLDSKGAAFEYYVRATLKGKNLGQYFTPRQLVQVMGAIVGRKKISNALTTGTPIKVLDPACGTGGFLVYLMQENLRFIDDLLQRRTITAATHVNLSRRAKEEVFFGSDANSGVACAAKMNMIIAGDGHTNIACEDSLATAKNWDPTSPDCDLILTNPPFGTSESESLSVEQLAEFPVRTSKGQHLFIQRMVQCTKPGGQICTVIDEGVLNTESARELRRWIFKTCKVRAVVRLPEETFKPNKINVRASLLYLERLATDDDDFEAEYPVRFIDLRSLGYEGSGDLTRGFKFEALLSEIENTWFDPAKVSAKTERWSFFVEQSQTIIRDAPTRLDFKYWEPGVRAKIKTLEQSGAKSIKALNKIPTLRGSSPPSDAYVDESDGYALVVKAGSNISKFGELIVSGDFIEKNLYDEYAGEPDSPTYNKRVVLKGDVLVASTGDGTLGKCCVYTSDKPAIADSHVTVIRVDDKQISPYYLCDYLRAGFGQPQINRLFTGSTGLIELSPQDVDRVFVDLLASRPAQDNVSSQLRAQERDYVRTISEAEEKLLRVHQALSGEH